MAYLFLNGKDEKASRAEFDFALTTCNKQLLVKKSFVTYKFADILISNEILGEILFIM